MTTVTGRNQFYQQQKKSRPTKKWFKGFTVETVSALLFPGMMGRPSWITTLDQF